MRRRVIQRGNLRRGDATRAIVTETLPEEVPIIFSNDGFYKNRTKIPYVNDSANELVDRILAASRNHTIPYRYSVVRDGHSTRGLNLLHPAAQERVAAFYHTYDGLICHYVRRSPASLRSPHKVGSSFYVRGPSVAGGGQRRSTVDTVSIETSVASPASYFSYNKFNRAHQFFGSHEYLHFEKKFPIFRTLDISKCFNSIYTHTLAWAIWDVDTAKENTQALGFANAFDDLMQFMNYRETNGICVGPEVSRVFAEVIFSEVDNRVIARLFENGLRWKVDYEFRRYVDDFYVFTRDVDFADRVTGAIQAELLKFNLHLNFEKTVTLHRPFSTNISRIVADTSDRLTAIFTKYIEYRFVGVGPNQLRIATPRKVRRADKLMRSSINDIKSVCALHQCEYGTVSDYIVSALATRIIELVDGHSHIEPNSLFGEEEYVTSLMLTLEMIYFFYTVNPTVRSSLNVARAAVMASGLFERAFPSRLPFLSESIVRWTLDLVRSMTARSKHSELAAVPVEVLNVLIPMREIASNEPLIDELVGLMCEEVEKFEYFQIVSFIYLVGGKPGHRHLVDKLLVQAKAIVAASPGPRIDAEAAHLCLDLLGCPHLSVAKRGAWFNTLRGQCGLPKLTRLASQAAVTSMEGAPWFVPWVGINLESILKKKELSPVY